MSQQINLLLPELKPRFDWLALPVVASLALAGLLLLVGLSTVTAMRADSLRAKEAAIKTQLLALQQQVQTLGQSLGARQGDSMLDKQIAAARLGVAQRQEVLNVSGPGRRDWQQCLFRPCCRVSRGKGLKGSGWSVSALPTRILKFAAG